MRPWNVRWRICARRESPGRVNGAPGGVTAVAAPSRAGPTTAAPIPTTNTAARATAATRPTVMSRTNRRPAESVRPKPTSADNAAQWPTRTNLRLWPPWNNSRWRATGAMSNADDEAAASSVMT